MCNLHCSPVLFVCWTIPKPLIVLIILIYFDKLFLLGLSQSYKIKGIKEVSKAVICSKVGKCLWAFYCDEWRSTRSCYISWTIYRFYWGPNPKPVPDIRTITSQGLRQLETSAMQLTNPLNQMRMVLFVCIRHLATHQSCVISSIWIIYGAPSLFRQLLG